MNPMRVLVVEDDQRVASFIQKGLEEEGLAVDVLHDGDDAGVQAQMVDYDLRIGSVRSVAMMPSGTTAVGINLSTSTPPPKGNPCRNHDDLS
jgi:CheY-like chemotaxis protein